MVNINSNRGNSKRGERAPSRTEGNKVYVSNIDFSCSHLDVKEAFKQVGDVAFVEMLKEHNQKPKGCAIIRFKENNMVDDAIRIMNRYELKGRKLVVKDERDAPKDVRISKDRKRPREEDPGPSVGFTSKFGNTFGLSVQFLESLGIDGPLVNRVFVANLDYSVNDETLEELFNIAGKVTDIELVRGEDGKSKGFGFIEFEHPVEAVQAISMLHNQIYHDRPMSVQLTRKEKKKKDGTLKLPGGLKGIGLGLGINGTPLKDVARTIEAGNQSSLLGAMPSGSGPSSLSVGMDMGGLSQNMNPNLGVGFGSGLGGGGLQGTVMHGNLGGASPMGGSLGAGLGSDANPSLGRSGMGLMDRPGGMGMGMGGLTASVQNQMRNLGGDSSLVSSSTSMGSFSGPSFSSNRNVVQITNLPNDYSWKSLQNLCMSFGDVTFAKIASRGVGVVHFENETSARRAVDMLDHQRFEGRTLETRLL